MLNTKIFFIWYKICMKKHEQNEASVGLSFACVVYSKKIVKILKICFYSLKGITDNCYS